MKLKIKKNTAKLVFALLIFATLLITVSPSILGSGEEERYVDAIVMFKPGYNPSFPEIKYRYRWERINGFSGEISYNLYKSLETSELVEFIGLNTPSIRLAEDNLDWGVDDIDAERVWGGFEDAIDVLPDLNAGEGIDVCVIDTGIDIDHPDLALNYKGGYDFVDNDTEPDDTYGHGTQCAGIIAAMDNGFGVIGVAPKVNIYALRITPNDTEIPVDRAISAIDWAINNQMDIISMSWGYDDDRPPLKAILEAAVEDIILVASVGNYKSIETEPDLSEAKKVRYPAKYDTTIGVGGVTQDYVRYKYRWRAEDDYGNLVWWQQGFCYGEGLDVVAPGRNINSTFKNNGYATGLGTSFAAPMVAGVCALILSKYPEMTPTQVKDLLIQTCEDQINNIPPDNNEDLYDAPGRDDVYGYGLVNAYYTCDDDPPEVTITSHDMGGWVKGSVTITASATDNSLVRKVAFKIDDGLWHEDTDETNGWSYDWDTTGYTTGGHNIWCRAYDPKGNYDEDVVSVGVDNILPTVDILSPSHYKTVKDIITITASASDNCVIQKVQFFIDSVLKYEDTDSTNGWAWNWNTRTSSEDEYHYVKCRAFDLADNYADHQHTVFVNNFPSEPGPGCPILSVFDGTGYIVEGLLDIHDPEGIDVLTTHTLITTPEPVSHHYLLKLTEHPATISHVDQVKLYGRMANGHLIPLHLTSAIHSSLGEVRSELWFSDDKRVDLHGTEHNGGLSEFITLEFMAPAHNKFIEFIFVIEGNNPIIK